MNLVAWEGRGTPRSASKLLKCEKCVFFNMNFAISFLKIGLYGARLGELIDAIETSMIKKFLLTRKFITKPSRKFFFYVKSSSELSIRAQLIFL